MIPLSDVNWGPIDALVRDEQFHLKWMESSSVKACLHSGSWIISGEKGSGKSAIRKAIVEIYGNQYLAAPIVDLDDFSFRPLYNNLFQFAKLTELSKTQTLSHFWQYSILIEMIKHCASKLPNIYGDLLSKQDEFLSVPTRSVKRVYDANDQAKVDRKPYEDISMPQRLLKLTEALWRKIDKATESSPKTISKVRKPKKANLIATSNLTADYISEMKTYPVNDRFQEMRALFFRRLADHKHRVILILDGFDQLRNDNAPSDEINLLFDSLADAIQSIHSYIDRPDGFEIKAFIPHDRYLNISLRDSDKVSTFQVAIRWDRSDLQMFLKKRLELTPKLSVDTFHKLWREVMPERVMNSHYKIEEDSFDYLIRHTMMRPRQLQIHLEYLSKSYYDQNIDPSAIAKSIAQSCRDMTSYFINEFIVDHPHLREYIGSLHGRDNVFEYKTLIKITQDALRRFDGNDSREAVIKKIDTLYAMGFFGVLRMIRAGEITGDIYCPPSKKGGRHYFDFFYKNPHPSISSMLAVDDLVAIHPIFFDYANLRAHPDLIVG
jgi:hypothetical protein